MVKKRRPDQTDEDVARWQGWILDRMAEADVAVERFEQALCGGLPPWIPEETRKRVRSIYTDASALGFTDRQLLNAVRRCESPRFQIPGLAPDGVAFLHNLYFLRHVAYVVSLGPERGLDVLAGPYAAYGWRRRQNEKSLHENLGGKKQTAERAPEWERWRAEGRKIRARNPHLSVSEMARRVRKALKITDSEHTIRRRLRGI